MSAERIAELKAKIANATIATSIESRARKNAMRNELVSLLESDLAAARADAERMRAALTTLQAAFVLLPATPAIQIERLRDELKYRIECARAALAGEG